MSNICSLFFAEIYLTMVGNFEWKISIKNGLRPLIFRNFFRNIQKIKNGLRPSSVAVRRHLPPGGKAVSKAEINFWNDGAIIRNETGNARPPGGSLGTRHLFKFLNGLLQVNCFSTAPHHRRFAAELPPEGKPWNKAGHFFEFLR